MPPARRPAAPRPGTAPADDATPGTAHRPGGAPRTDGGSRSPDAPRRHTPAPRASSTPRTASAPRSPAPRTVGAGGTSGSVARPAGSSREVGGSATPRTGVPQQSVPRPAAPRPTPSRARSAPPRPAASRTGGNRPGGGSGGRGSGDRRGGRAEAVQQRLPRLFTVRAMVLLIVASIAFVLVFPTLRQYLDQQVQVEVLRAEVAAAEQRNEDLQAELDRWSDPAYVEAQARERLAFVMPGERALRVADPETVEDRATDAATTTSPATTTDADDPARPWYARIWDSVQVAGVAGTGTPETGENGSAPAGGTDPSDDAGTPLQPADPAGEPTAPTP